MMSDETERKRLQEIVDNRPKLAFPSESDLGNGVRAVDPGMTLLDYFAAAALAGIQDRYPMLSRHEQASEAYDLAEAMLAERAKRQGGE